MVGDYDVSLLLRCSPTIQRNLETSSRPLQQCWMSSGYLAFGVFIHHTAITWVFLHTGAFAALDSGFYAQIGLASVALFFMITAFLFWGRLLEKAVSTTGWPSLCPVFLPVSAVFATDAAGDCQRVSHPGWTPGRQPP